VENNAFGELTQHWHSTHHAHSHPVALVALLWIKLLAFTLFHAFALGHGKLIRPGRGALQEMRKQIYRSVLCGWPVAFFSSGWSERRKQEHGVQEQPGKTGETEGAGSPWVRGGRDDQNAGLPPGKNRMPAPTTHRADRSKSMRCRRIRLTHPRRFGKQPGSWAMP
jgi:hypothetical protein